MHRGAKQPRRRPRNQKCSRKAESAVNTLLQLERTEGTKEDGITAAYNLLNVKYDANAYALPKSKPTEAKQTREERDETRRQVQGAKHRGQRYQTCLPGLTSSTNLLGGPAIGATSRLQLLRVVA